MWCPTHVDLTGDAAPYQKYFPLFFPQKIPIPPNIHVEKKKKKKAAPWGLDTPWDWGEGRLKLLFSS